MSLLLMLGLVFSATTARAAVCLANGRPCGNQGLPSNDRLCCPGSICGWGNTCQPGCRILGVSYRSGNVNPNNACQVCQPVLSTTQWSARPNGTSCNDNSRCTQVDRCQSGTCVGSSPIVCTPPDQCHAGSCNPATGTCSYPAKPNGSTCNDYLRCTTNDVCTSGTCGGTAVVCQPLDQCHDSGTCDPGTGACSNPPSPDTTPCIGDPCFFDVCLSGSCGPLFEIHCTNGVQDCSETGVDCGGPDCAACVPSCSNPHSCLALEQCNATGSCQDDGACFMTTDGRGLCARSSTGCGPLTRCPGGQSDCEPGSVCIEQSCCGEPVCLPPSTFCGPEAAFRSFSAPPSASGLTTGRPH